MRGRSSYTSTSEPGPRRSPSTSTSPEVGRSMVDATCSRVVLPAPFEPSTAQFSPSLTVQSTPVRSVDVPRRTVTSRRTRTGSACLGR